MMFHGWEPLLRTFLIGVLSYGALVFLLRISGKRTLSKWNAFDFVVTVALGSSFATAFLSKDTAFVQVALAFALLVFLQFLATWLSVRFRGVERLLKAEPALLVYRGQLRRDALVRERVSEEEIRAALRGKGIGSIEEVGAVVLETDGSFSVIPKLAERSRSTLEGVSGFSGED
jgi:uncharacterized membrane protein YcaP (DUF421 family)